MEMSKREAPETVEEKGGDWRFWADLIPRQGPQFKNADAAKRQRTRHVGAPMSFNEYLQRSSHLPIAKQQQKHEYQWEDVKQHMLITTPLQPHTPRLSNVLVESLGQLFMTTAQTLIPTNANKVNVNHHTTPSNWEHVVMERARIQCDRI